MFNYNVYRKYTRPQHFLIINNIHWGCMDMDWQSIALTTAGVIGGGSWNANAAADNKAD
jgi:hypothetical protein